MQLRGDPLEGIRDHGHVVSLASEGRAKMPETEFLKPLNVALVLPRGFGPDNRPAAL